jgi:hypothetical protein
MLYQGTFVLLELQGEMGRLPKRHGISCALAARSSERPRKGDQLFAPLQQKPWELCHVNLNCSREVSTTQFEFMRLSQLATSGKLLLGRRGACGGM